MTAKEYLSQIARSERHINMLRRELEDLRLMCYPGSPDYSGDRVQHSYDPDKTGKLVANITKTENRILSELDRLVKLRDHISKQILAMPNARTAEVLHCRYVLLMKWEDISVKTKTDLRWVYRLHGQGLIEFERQYMKSPLKATKHV